MEHRSRHSVSHAAATDLPSAIRGLSGNETAVALFETLEQEKED